MSPTDLTSRRRFTAASCRGVLGVALVAATAVPLGLATPAAAAVAPATSKITLTDVIGARIGRGGAPGVVRATARNDSTDDATGVRVRYHLPAGVRFAPAASSPGCTTAEAIVTCALGTVAAGASVPVAIGLTEPSDDAVLGTRAGYFFAPTTDGFDPAAGEVLMSTWDHDAGAEGTDLSMCWPVGDPSPNMDVAGGVCDGSADAAALVPDETSVLDAFPAPFSQSLVRSWQFETEITAPATGQYHACGTMIDDGGYLAIAPVGQELTPASIVATVLSYGSATGAPFTMTGGTTYRVVMRVVNRGFDGIDNGADGGTLAGWTAYGIAPLSESCGTPDAAVFGTADTAWIGRTLADVVVVGTSDLHVAGAIESAPSDGRRTASVRLSNAGPDAGDVRLSIGLPPSGVLVGSIDGCDAVSTTPVTCSVSDLVAGAANDRVVSFSFSSDTPGAPWTLDALSTIDDHQADNVGPTVLPGT